MDFDVQGRDLGLNVCPIVFATIYIIKGVKLNQGSCQPAT